MGTTFTQIDYPSATLTSTWGINSAGQIVGNHYGSDGIAHGYFAVASGKGAIAQHLANTPAPANAVDAGARHGITIE